jgi:hypothetical protein
MCIYFAPERNIDKRHPAALVFFKFSEAVSNFFAQIAHGREGKTIPFGQDLASTRKGIR